MSFVIEINTIAEAIPYYNKKTDTIITFKKKVENLARTDNPVFENPIHAAIYDYCISKIDEAEFAVIVPDPDYIYPIAYKFYIERNMKLTTLLKHIPDLPVFIKKNNICLNNTMINWSTYCVAPSPLLKYVPDHYLVQIVNEMDFSNQNPSRWHTDFYNICDRYVTEEKRVELVACTSTPYLTRIMDNITSYFDKQFPLDGFNRIIDEATRFPIIYSPYFPKEHRLEPLDLLIKGGSTSCDSYIKFLIGIMNEHKDIFNKCFAYMLNNYKPRYLPIFTTEKFYNNLIEIIETYNIDMESRIGESKLFHFVIQARRFDVAKSLLDKGVLLFNSHGELITGAENRNIFTFLPSGLINRGIDISTHKKEVYEFLLDYFKDNMEMKEKILNIDLNTGLAKVPFVKPIDESPIGKAKSLLEKLKLYPGMYEQYKSHRIMMELDAILDANGLSLVDIDKDE